MSFRHLLRRASFSLWFLPLAAYWAVLVYYLGAQWSAYEQYTYGWAVPFLCLYLLWRRTESRARKAGEERGFGEQKAVMEKAGPEVGGRTPKLSGPAFSFSAFQLFSICLLAFLYLPTRLFHEANPIWRLTSWLWTLEVVGLTLLLLYPLTQNPARNTPPASRITNHVSRFTFPVSALTFSDLVFPICFFLVAVPWPSALENLLTQWLMRLNTTTTVEFLGVLGIPALQHGNTIEVATGVVGINEACSGIRSFQATLMISLFLGELYALSVKRRAFCVFAGFALAFVLNVGRTLLLTWAASAKGIDAVASWHDPAGVSILAACFLCLWLITRAMRKTQTKSLVATAPNSAKLPVRGSTFDVQRSMLDVPSFSETANVPASPGQIGFSISAFQRLSLCLGIWFLLVETGTQLWYRSHEHAAASAEWSVQRPYPDYTEVPVAASVLGQFRADQHIELRWRGTNGAAWQLFYFRWLPDFSLAKRVAIQLAKTHGPEKCLPAVGMTLKSYLGVVTVSVAGMELAMQQYVFSAEGKVVHIFYAIYEDPTGSGVLANRRQDTVSRVKAALAGSRNYGQRFLEVAVTGYDHPEDAKAALAQQLDKLIRVEPVSPRR